MDVLIARTPSGHLHGVSCANPPGFAETYIATMRRQGCTVEQISMSEWATRQHLRTAPVGKGGNWTPDEAPPAAVPEAPSPALDAVQDAPGAAAPATRPWKLFDPSRPHDGCEVDHLMAANEEEAVRLNWARTPREFGERDATFELAAPAFGEFGEVWHVTFTRGGGERYFTPLEVRPVPDPPPSSHALPSPDPKPPHMPSLFDL